MVALQRHVELTRRPVEVGDVAVFFKFIERVGNRDIMCGLDSWPPEAAAQFDLRLPHFLKTAKRRRVS